MNVALHVGHQDARCASVIPMAGIYLRLAAIMLIAIVVCVCVKMHVSTMCMYDTHIDMVNGCNNNNANACNGDIH